MKINIDLTPRQFQYIYEFLYNTKLGNRNEFEKEISELMALWEDINVHDHVEAFEMRNGIVGVKVEFDEHGPTFAAVQTSAPW